MEFKNFITLVEREWGFMKNEMSSSAMYEYLYTKITSRIHLPYKFLVYFAQSQDVDRQIILPLNLF